MACVGMQQTSGIATSSWVSSGIPGNSPQINNTQTRWLVKMIASATRPQTFTRSAAEGWRSHMTRVKPPQVAMNTPARASNGGVIGGGAARTARQVMTVERANSSSVNTLAEMIGRSGWVTA